MTVILSDTDKRFFEQPIVANLGTIMPDGRPQVNPVWVDYDGTTIRFSTLQGSQKDKNLKARKFATFLLVDPQNPYSYIEVRGQVAETVTEGADELIDTLSKKYLGLDQYPNRREGEVRVTYMIKPDKVNTFGQ